MEQFSGENKKHNVQKPIHGEPYSIFYSSFGSTTHSFTVIHKTQIETQPKLPAMH